MWTLIALLTSYALFLIWIPLRDKNETPLTDGEFLFDMPVIHAGAWICMIIALAVDREAAAVVAWGLVIANTISAFLIFPRTILKTLDQPWIAWFRFETWADGESPPKKE